MRTALESCRNLLWSAPFVLASLLAGCMGHTGLTFPWSQTAAPHDSLEHLTSATFDARVLKCEKTVLVDFYAEWCGPCSKLGPVLEEFAREHPEIRVVKVNVDENRNLADRYKVQSMPSLLVFQGGQEKTRSLGVITKEEMASMTKNGER
jgi:thioredoxin 1